MHPLDVEGSLRRPARLRIGREIRLGWRANDREVRGREAHELRECSHIVGDGGRAVSVDDSDRRPFAGQTLLIEGREVIGGLNVTGLIAARGGVWRAVGNGGTVTIALVGRADSIGSIRE